MTFKVTVDPTSKEKCLLNEGKGDTLSRHREFSKIRRSKLFIKNHHTSTSPN